MGEPRIVTVPFTQAASAELSARGGKFVNWPVVYVLDGTREVYVGETLSASKRLRQHVDSRSKQGVTRARVVLDETFNKSACLDLESRLIRLFAGDGSLSVLNGNDGITDADYYRRAEYQPAFDAVFEQLRDAGLFTRSVAEIENSDLFKLSPFKALNPEQAIAVEDIVEGLVDDMTTGETSTIVVQGEPGTGKTIVGIYLVKLLRDIASGMTIEDNDGEAMFSEFFVEDVHRLLSGMCIGLVVPQQSLRESVRRVFAKTPALDRAMVLSPFDVGKAARRGDEGAPPFDVLVVDEAHRLNHRANQPSGPLNAEFASINERLFGTDDNRWTQLDWIRAQSRHQVFLVDVGQRVRPADLPVSTLAKLVEDARSVRRRYSLTSQMRVAGGGDYIAYVRQMLGDGPPPPEVPVFDGYELGLFDSFPAMLARVRERNDEDGLSRLVAGFAWPWVSRKDPEMTDIVIDGVGLPWNRTQTDWISSPSSLDEVGSIHTVQGYDLNYAGVIIGPDLRLDPRTGRIAFNRARYFDKKGMENNRRLGIVYSDADMLEFVRNVYSVLLTRGMRGTFVYVCDDALRERLSRFLPRA